jgi:predicted ArsR family transcriptional regulator
MPNERISMSKLKQLIGLQSSNLSVRALARALGLSVGAVAKYLRALRACGIDAAEAETPFGGRARVWHRTARGSTASSSATDM